MPNGQALTRLLAVQWVPEGEGAQGGVSVSGGGAAELIFVFISFFYFFRFFPVRRLACAGKRQVV